MLRAEPSTRPGFMWDLTIDHNVDDPDCEPILLIERKTPGDEAGSWTVSWRDREWTGVLFGNVFVPLNDCAGYFFAPPSMVPLSRTPVVLDPSSYRPSKGIITRYGKKLLAQGSAFYKRIKISDL